MKTDTIGTRKRTAAALAAVVVLAALAVPAAAAVSAQTTVTDSPSADVAPGETFSVTVQLENTGDTDSVAAAITLISLPDGFEINDTELNSGGFLLDKGDGLDVGEPVAWGVPGEDGNVSEEDEPPAAGETVSVTFEIAVGSDVSPGEYTLEFQGDAYQSADNVKSDTVSTTVSVGESGLARFDTNSNGQIGLNEVLNAITAFNTGGQIGGQPVTLNQVLNVITAFNTGQSV